MAAARQDVLRRLWPQACDGTPFLCEFVTAFGRVSVRCKCPRVSAQARKDPEYHQLLEFRRKIEDKVEPTTTFGGTWCQMRFGDAQMETSDVMPIAGTIVLTRQADRVIQEMRNELLQQAYPLYTEAPKNGFRETFADEDA